VGTNYRPFRVWKAATSKAALRQQQDWFLMWHRDARDHPLAARGTATLCTPPPPALEPEKPQIEGGAPLDAPLHVVLDAGQVVREAAGAPGRGWPVHLP
jgi:hypothetical protein